MTADGKCAATDGDGGGNKPIGVVTETAGAGTKVRVRLDGVAVT